VHFGPLWIDLSPRLIIDSLELDIDSPITHFWGKNGAGKTTLLNLITQECIKNQISFAYISQNYRANWLWWASVGRNFELALLNQKNEPKPKSFLEIPMISRQLSWLQPLLENGLKINFSTKNELEASGLSGGQLQRVILLRELLRKPKLLMLDEAFSALDKKVQETIIEWLLGEQEKEKFQIISIAHDREILKNMPGKILYLSNDNNSKMQIQTISNLESLDNENQ